VSSTAEGAVRRAADSASNLVLTLKDAQLGVMDSAPKDVKDTQWFKDFRRSVTDLETTGTLGSQHALIHDACAQNCRGLLCLVCANLEVLCQRMARPEAAAIMLDCMQL
jgi:hypothetical protein